LADVHIYKPSKTATQSGLVKTRMWLLEFETQSPKKVEPLMGWMSSGDTMQQVTLRFRTKESAIAFAERNGWTYRVSISQLRNRIPKSYADNFKYRQT